MIVTVHVVGNRHKVYIVLTKEHLRVKTSPSIKTTPYLVRFLLTQASHFDVKILLAGVNPSPPCRPRAGTSRQHCRKVSVKIGFGNMAEPDHSGLP